jgi:hypothetical protein
MGEDVQNEHAFGFAVDPRVQPVGIPVDIEYGPSTNNISVNEITPHLAREPGTSSSAAPVRHGALQRI